MSKQVIKHGATIDVASTAEMAEILSKTLSQQHPEEYRRYKGIVLLDGTGTGASRAADIKVPSQYDLTLERITIGGPGAVSALVGIYENQVSDLDMLEIIQLGTVGKYSDSFSNRIWVTANSAIIVSITGGVPAGQVTYNLQGRLIEKAT